ncbi:hypothetical protein LXA43DRAFT_367607 [Ganoderma leucocontextum]|nr:hypothetical protein LXA43DRAFT_367607 [Ganoderma leucocontextum]
MRALLLFTLVTLTMLPSGIVCDTIPAAPAPNDSLSIQTPDPPPIYGKSFTFQWAGDRPNFTLKLFDMTPTLRVNFSNISSHSFTWSPVDVSSGTEMYLVLTDALSNSTYSGKFTIQSRVRPTIDTFTPGMESIFAGGTVGAICFRTSVLTVRHAYPPGASTFSASTSQSIGLSSSAQASTTTVAGHVSSGAASPSVSEDTPARPSASPSPPALGTGAIAGISLGVLVVVTRTAAIACLFILYRYGRYQCSMGRIRSRRARRRVTLEPATKRKVPSSLSNSESPPVPVFKPLRKSGDSWLSTQSSETRSEKAVAWNPGLFARDMPEEDCGSCSPPLPLAHQKLSTLSSSPESNVNDSLLSLGSTDLSTTKSRGVPRTTVSTHPSIQRPQTPLSITVTSVDEPEVHGR